MPKKFIPASGDEYAFGASAMRARPIFAQHMAFIIQQSTAANVFIANMLSIILHIEAMPAMTMYTAIRNDGARDAALKAIAETMLKKEEDKKEFYKIQRKFRACEDDRNLIAHGMWVAVKSQPDLIIYYDPREYIKWKTEINVAGAKDDLDGFLQLVTKPNAFLANPYSYTEKEFLDMQRKYQLLDQRIKKFTASLIDASRKPDARIR